MWRSLHSIFGTIAAFLVIALAITGAVLATKPIYDRMQATPMGQEMSVADALRVVAEGQPRITVEKLQRSVTGQWKVAFSRGGRRGERVINLETGKFAKERKEPETYSFMRRLHRSFLLGDAGRIFPAIGGIAMLTLCISGMSLLLRRVGGLGALFGRMKAQGVDGIHSYVGRLAIVPLIIMAVSAVWMSGVTYDIIPLGDGLPPAYPESLEKLDPVDPWDLHGLQDMPLANVQEVIFPIPEDWFDVWAVRTQAGYVFYDQFTGDILSEDRLSLSERAYDLIYFLHTAEGSVWWAIVLFFAALSIPLFAITGIIIWARRQRQSGGRIRNNASNGAAEVVILVGSETGSTWAFGRALHEGFVKAGTPARLAAMNSLRSHYPSGKMLICLAATYGDGEAPESAKRFLARLPDLRGDMAHATLAFGDKSFPKFCAFGHEVNAQLAQKFGAPILATTEVDKQSAQTFEAWCRDLSAAINLPLEVIYTPRKPKTTALTLTHSAEFGRALGAITTVLRFDGKRLPKHRPGDLVAIYPSEGGAARLYSLGSDSKRDEFLEICVRHQEGGLMSPRLCALEIGDTIDVKIMTNERFHMPPDGPVVMIGAGTGIAPFTGMIRQNAPTRAVDLSWGGRDPQNDAIYGDEIRDWVDEGRLHVFEAAWSRLDPKAYVQDRIRGHKTHLAARLAAGATIMVCGGASMAQAVRNEIDILAAEMGTSVTELQRQNRYLEDVY